MEKIYCYIDESGQHSEGEYFIVSVVVADHHRDTLSLILKNIEKQSGKNKYKWTKAKDDFRTASIKAVLENPVFKGRLFSSTHHDTQAYVDVTVSATAWAIQNYAQEEYKATVIVDGLQRSERHRFGATLRKSGISTQKIVGADDQKEPFIRLADALCGFIADAQQGRQEYVKLLRKAEVTGVIRLK